MTENRFDYQKGNGAGAHDEPPAAPGIFTTPTNAQVRRGLITQAETGLIPKGDKTLAQLEKIIRGRK